MSDLFAVQAVAADQAAEGPQVQLPLLYVAATAIGVAFILMSLLILREDAKTLKRIETHETAEANEDRKDISERRVYAKMGLIIGSMIAAVGLMALGFELL